MMPCHHHRAVVTLESSKKLDSEHLQVKTEGVKFEAQQERAPRQMVPVLRFRLGAPGGTRTPDLQISKKLFYPLNYRGHRSPGSAGRLTTRPTNDKLAGQGNDTIVVRGSRTLYIAQPCDFVVGGAVDNSRTTCEAHLVDVGHDATLTGIEVSDSPEVRAARIAEAVAEPSTNETHRSIYATSDKHCSRPGCQVADNDTA